MFLGLLLLLTGCFVAFVGSIVAFVHRYFTWGIVYLASSILTGYLFWLSYYHVIQTQ